MMAKIPTKPYASREEFDRDIEYLFSLPKVAAMWVPSWFLKMIEDELPR